MRDRRITLPRPERELLIKIRTGKWSLDRLSSHVNSLFIELEDAEAKSSLPDMPNRKLLSRVVSETYLNHWSAMKRGLPELRKKMIDTLKPKPSLLLKLGSIAVHAEEMLSPGGHVFDRAALEALLSDSEVQNWIKDMGVYLPAKRWK